MFFSFCNFFISAKNKAEQKAAELFRAELTSKFPTIKAHGGAAFEFVISNENDCEDFYIEIADNKITFSAHRLRGLIYAYSMFLRKAVFENGEIVLKNNISGTYSPYKKIRGHQLGYRDLNNTYEAWSVEQYRRYILDLMMFGTNTIEGICDGENQSCLMKLSASKMLEQVSQICNELDIDLSVWHPTYSKESNTDIEQKINEYYKNIQKLDVLFIPGGDPGDMMPDKLFERCKFIKEQVCKYHPNVKMWISAQAPHQYKNWGKKFIEELEKEPDFLNGIIYGPNHAMSLEDLRKYTPKKYPLRFYPDVTHCVRCEYPVHFDKDDWHYAFASAFGRESINPRPAEYRHIYKITEAFVVGSVTYSDGIHDDFNKIIWSGMDFQKDTDIFEIAKDYARAFIPNVNPQDFADCMFALEKNWEGSPKENPVIDITYKKLLSLSTVENEKNYRFVMALFKAECDMLIKERFNFENLLIEKAKKEISFGNFEKAKEILLTNYTDEYKNLREKINYHAQLLFSLIGIQLDVENYHGKNWERGCTLETIDKPITDRLYLLNKLNQVTHKEDLLDLINLHKDEDYFSFAFHGFEKIGKQKGEFYMDFQGDTPDNDGTLPMRLTKVYDHYNIDFSFSTKKENPKIRITYKRKSFNDDVTDFKIKINDEIFYHGKPYGGEIDENYQSRHLHQNYTAVLYTIPNKLLKNGYGKVEITEPTTGFMISEISIL